MIHCYCQLFQAEIVNINDYIFCKKKLFAGQIKIFKQTGDCGRKQLAIGEGSYFHYTRANPQGINAEKRRGLNKSKTLGSIRKMLR